MEAFIFLGIYVVPPIIFHFKGSLYQSLIWVWLLLFFPFLIIGIYLFEYYRNYRILFDSEQITIYSWSREKQVAKWNAIKHVKRRPALLSHTLFKVVLKTDIYDLIIDPSVIGLKTFEHQFDISNPDLAPLFDFSLRHHQSPL